MPDFIKKTLVAFSAFFLWTLTASFSYAALSSWLSSGDLKSAGDQVSLASWNRIVNSIIELDTRTATPATTKILGTWGSSSTNIPNGTWTYIGDNITLTPGKWVVYYNGFYDHDGATAFGFWGYNHPYLSTTTNQAQAVSYGNLTSCWQNYCPISSAYQVNVASTTTYYVVHLVSTYWSAYVRLRANWGNFYAIKTN